MVYSRSVVGWRSRRTCTTVLAVQSSTVCRMRSDRHRSHQTPRRRRRRRHLRLLRRRGYSRHRTRCRFRCYRIAGRATVDWRASSSGYDAYYTAEVEYIYFIFEFLYYCGCARDCQAFIVIGTQPTDAMCVPRLRRPPLPL